MIRSKYGARKCDQHTPPHDSLRECRRFAELKLLERAGEIRNLQQQVPFELLPKQELFGRKLPAVRYVADFVYDEPITGQPRGTQGWPRVVEDSKGMQTPIFRLKARLLKQIHGVELRLS